ncbi:MAG: PilW family protein [Methylotenera sp.]
MTKIQKTCVQSGFTIVELMVGLVIGLIATLVIMQTFAAFEGNKRSTTGISDAQTSGSIGLYMVQRELQFAGYGIPVISGTMPAITVAADARTYRNYTGMTDAQIKVEKDAAEAAYNAQLAADAFTVQAGEVYSALKCNPAPTMNLDLDNDPGTPDVLNVDIITPVRIIDGVTNGTGSDSVAIHYNTTARGAMPTRISSVSGADYVAVKNNMGCRENDLVLVTRNTSPSPGDTTCTATRVTSKNSPVDKNQLRQTLASPDSPIAIYVTSNAGMAPGNRLACLGNHVVTTFDVVGNELRKNSQPVLNEIVSLQAQYGISATANSEIVPDNGWVDATGATWANPTVANRNRIKAVRIAVIARNNLLEKDVVSQTCGGGAAGPAEVCIWKDTPDEQDPNLAASLGADWNRYRYRVYEVVVPLRNMLAASPQL